MKIAGLNYRVLIISTLFSFLKLSNGAVLAQTSLCDYNALNKIPFSVDSVTTYNNYLVKDHVIGSIKNSTSDIEIRMYDAHQQANLDDVFILRVDHEKPVFSLCSFIYSKYEIRNGFEVVGKTTDGFISKKNVPVSVNDTISCTILNNLINAHLTTLPGEKQLIKSIQSRKNEKPFSFDPIYRGIKFEIKIGSQYRNLVYYYFDALKDEEYTRQVNLILNLIESFRNLKAYEKQP
jgi:hypothetical protein